MASLQHAFPRASPQLLGSFSDQAGGWLVMTSGTPSPALPEREDFRRREGCVIGCLFTLVFVGTILSSSRLFNQQNFCATNGGTHIVVQALLPPGLLGADAFPILKANLLRLEAGGVI